jgi:ATP-dependent DNA ligase
MTIYTKAKDWSGKALTGLWEVTLKIDGVRAFWHKGEWTSRNGKPLYNLPRLRTPKGPSEGFEAYAHDPKRSSKENFKATIQAVRAKNKPERALGIEHLYPLHPVDARLVREDIENPTIGQITELLEFAVKSGHEGLILRQGTKWIKVKPEETYDVRIKSFIEGEGKHRGRLGAVMTSRGKVGTGFTDEERKAIWDDRPNYLGKIIEVGCMGLTEAGKFRHPRYEGLRLDKDETDDLGDDNA